MRLPIVLCLALATVACNATPPPVAPARPAPSPHDAMCAVWDREVSFAKSVQDHDAAAFAEHVHPNAVFVGGDDKLLRGRDAIVERWQGIVRGEKLHLGWHPTAVVVTGDSHIALSRGPAWIELLKPDANPRFLIGAFQSIWILGDDGVWRVTEDGGTPDPVPATEADVQKLKASIPARCP
jgi:ketosteroid isomerase-like protein